MWDTGAELVGSGQEAVTQSGVFLLVSDLLEDVGEQVLASAFSLLLDMDARLQHKLLRACCRKDYMLSKQGYLSDRDGNWHLHLMFFVSQAGPSAWGADLPGSPIVAFNDTWEHMTVFLIPVRRWSDGTPDL